MKRKKKLLQTDGCGVNFLGFGRADWENYFSFFFFFISRIISLGRQDSQRKARKKEKKKIVVEDLIIF